MAVIKETKAERIKGFLARNSKLVRAVVLALVFFVLGACTIGGFSSSGDTYFARKNAQIVFYLDYSAAGGEQLEKIYVNVGSVYEVLPSARTTVVSSMPMPSGRCMTALELFRW